MQANCRLNPDGACLVSCQKIRLDHATQREASRVAFWNLQAHQRLLHSKNDEAVCGPDTFWDGGIVAKPAKKRHTMSRCTYQPRRPLSDLFHEMLKEIYFAEDKIITTLMKMAKAAQSRNMAAASNKQVRETQRQVKRLDQVFRLLGKPACGQPFRN